MKSKSYFKKTILKFVISLMFVMILFLALPNFVLAERGFRLTDDTIGDYDIYVYPTYVLDGGLIPHTVYEDDNIEISVLSYSHSYTTRIKTFIGYIPIKLAYQMGVLSKEDFKNSSSYYINYHEKQIVDKVTDSVTFKIMEVDSSGFYTTIYDYQTNINNEVLQNFKNLFSDKTFMDEEYVTALGTTKYKVSVYDINQNEFVFFITDNGYIYEYTRIPSVGMTTSRIVLFDSIDLDMFYVILENGE